MLNESSYEFVKPGEDFYWYGRPMPKQDEDSIQACMSKEDIAYLMEWQMDMRALVSYGNVNSYLGNDLTNNDYWKTQRCNRGVLNSIDSVCKSWYSAELWNTYSTRQCVSFTLGD